VGQVFGRFLPEVRTMLVTDPAIPASVNVATMLAAVHGRLVATPLTAAQYDLPKGTLPDSWEDLDDAPTSLFLDGRTTGSGRRTATASRERLPVSSLKAQR
jgi:hypothetical protein